MQDDGIVRIYLKIGQQLKALAVLEIGVQIAYSANVPWPSKRNLRW